ncbi:response regulator [Natrarchaeobaculum sulfurireducens]|uniref:Two-component system response regulator n=1 Tax=Natrarchaeobaculum sulfurireducens TaxID=2044521 RepID=A0A346PQ10_9EURY|nr:response regulator [Natrarchaeobaculum sulfurireducens]AXR81605.1 Two-component system response regulator [Natrarchaeobaculum sulfurireducens]
MSTRFEEPVEILLVEDNPGDVRLVEIALRELSTDTELDVATDGTKALETLSGCLRNESVPDLVLLDLNLPRMGGFEFLDEIQDQPALARIPILVLTGSNACEDVAESYERAANAYLTKPADPAAYIEMVEAVADFWFDRVALPPTCA